MNDKIISIGVCDIKTKKIIIYMIFVISHVYYSFNEKVLISWGNLQISPYATNQDNKMKILKG